jgi:hypothetical protein
MIKTLSTIAVSAIAVIGLNISAASAAPVTLNVVTAPPGINESALEDCVFGNPSLGCEAQYQLPTGAPGGFVTGITHDYLVSDLRALVENFFTIGIDSNTAAGATITQMLTQFELSVDYGGDGTFDEILFDVNVPFALDPLVAQGNGFTDFAIFGFSLLGLSDDDVVRFTLSLTGLTDGAEQFFILDAPEVPIPGAIWLMGAGLAGLGFAGRKKKRQA